MPYQTGQIVLADRSANPYLGNGGEPIWKPGRIQAITEINHKPIYHVVFLDGQGGVFAKEDQIKSMDSWK
jgi:hypothetical protein